MCFALRAPNPHALSLTPARMWAADARSSPGHRIMACINQVPHPCTQIAVREFDCIECVRTPHRRNTCAHARTCTTHVCTHAHLFCLGAVSAVILGRRTSFTTTRRAAAAPVREMHLCFPAPCLSPPVAFRERTAAGSVCLRSEEDLIPGCLARQTHISHTHSHKQIHSQASMHLQAATRPWAPPLDGTRPRSLLSCALAYGMRFLVNLFINKADPLCPGGASSRGPCRGPRGQWARTKPDQDGAAL